ncbi:TIGR02391 family protein [Kribbella sp. NPDC051620]|uniref:TIGR02391 family protein n=1 Tax=Kribbella sp. NPDC051620 TaxID=3364120 RepID=UPI0037881890
MDTAWMQEKLKYYLVLVKQYDMAYERAGYEWNSDCEAFNNEAGMLLPTIEQILKVLGVMPSEDLTTLAYGGGGKSATAVRRALGTLRDRDEWAVRLAPQAPTFAADQFHPWVWQAAAVFWDAGQPAAAVEAGSKSLTARIQQKSGSSLVDRELAADVFSSKASSSNRVRLWLPGDRSTDMWRSRQDGLHNLAIGAYAGIRNVAAHSHQPGWSDHEAMEYLAVLSTVARWADETEITSP